MKLIGHSLTKTLCLLKQNDEAIARWVSHIVSPHIVLVVITSAITLSFSQNPVRVLQWLVGVLSLVVIPPVLYLLWLVYTGFLVDIHMPNRKARLRPLAVSILWMLFCLGLIHYWQAPQVVQLFVFAATVLTGILGLITLFWKISFHGAAITAAATATLMVGGLSTWPVMLLVPLVGWARIRLRRHTPRQVIYGSLMGALIAFVLANNLLPMGG